MDTTGKANVAEQFIASELLKIEVLVAKSFFDQNGADLLAMLSIDDFNRFCRVQCKYRSLVNSPSQDVAIPCKYVTDGFVLFVYIDTGEFGVRNLFCFFGIEVQNWAKSGDDEHVRSFSKTQLAGLESYRFSPGRAERIKSLIMEINQHREWEIMRREYAAAAAHAHLQIGPAQFSATMTFTPPPAAVEEP